MTNYKIIELDEKLPDVLIFRDFDDQGDECVVIHSCGTQEDNDNYIATDKIKFPSKELAVCFVRDFSEKSAIEWCKQQSISY